MGSIQGDLITTQVKLIQQTENLKKMQKELKILASTDPMTHCTRLKKQVEIKL